MQPYLYGLAYVATFVVVAFIAKMIYNLSSPDNTFKTVSEDSNVAVAFSISGYLVAVGTIFACVIQGPSNGLVTDIQNIFIYSAVGFVLLVTARLINDKLSLQKFCNKSELFSHNNLAVGIVQAASYVCSGLIIGAALMGEGSIITAIAFYLLGQVVIVAFSKIYDKLTKFDLQAELQSQNVAVATNFALTTLAAGIILFHSIAGGFVDWQTSLQAFALDTAIALLILPLGRFILDKIVFSNICIDGEIQKGNSAIALIEGFTLVSLAIAILVSF